MDDFGVFDGLSTLAIFISAVVAWKQYSLKERLGKEAEDRENLRLRLNLYKRLKRNARQGPHEPSDTLRVEAKRCGVEDGDIDVLLHYQAVIAATYVENIDTKMTLVTSGTQRIVGYGAYCSRTIETTAPAAFGSGYYRVLSPAIQLPARCLSRTRPSALVLAARESTAYSIRVSLSFVFLVNALQQELQERQRLFVLADSVRLLHRSERSPVKRKRRILLSTVLALPTVAVLALVQPSDDPLDIPKFAKAMVTTLDWAMPLVARERADTPASQPAPIDVTRNPLQGHPSLGTEDPLRIVAGQHPVVEAEFFQPSPRRDLAR